jgi:DNA-binding XRE family transcriptional regulator
MNNAVDTLVKYQIKENASDADICRAVGISVPTYNKLKKGENPHRITEILINKFLQSPQADTRARRKKLIEYKTAFQLTDEQLAAKIGLTRQTIDNIFKGRSKANISTLRMIDNFLAEIIEA